MSDPRTKDDQNAAPTAGPWARRGLMAVMGAEGTGGGGRGQRTICMMISADDAQSQADMRLILAARTMYDALAAQDAADWHYTECAECDRTGACAVWRELQKAAHTLRDAARTLAGGEGQE